MLLIVLISYLARPDALWSWFSSHEVITVLGCLFLA